MSSEFGGNVVVRIANKYNFPKCNCSSTRSRNNSCPNSNRSFSTIYLVRHGQTIGNASRIFLDPSKEVLSPKGRLQANAAGEHLSNVKFDRAYASSLVRARNTAKIILQHSQFQMKEGIAFEERIKEVDYGIFKGQSYDESQKLKGQNVRDSYPYKEFYVEGTEEIELVLLRLDSFMNELFETLDRSPEPQTVLIVSHANLIRIFMKYMKLSPEKFQVENFSSSLHTKCLKNTAYHKFQVGHHSPSCKAACREPRLICFWESHQSPHLPKKDTTRSS